MKSREIFKIFSKYFNNDFLITIFNLFPSYMGFFIQDIIIANITEFYRNANILAANINYVFTLLLLTLLLAILGSDIPFWGRAPRLEINSSMRMLDFHMLDFHK